MSNYRKYLKTLRRLPDEVVLDMGTREFIMSNGMTCVCGWALRAALSMADGKSPEEFEVIGFPDRLAAKFGGCESEWDAIYLGVTGCPCEGCNGLALLLIERAFVERVLEAVG